MPPMTAEPALCCAHLQCGTRAATPVTALAAAAGPDKRSCDLLQAALEAACRRRGVLKGAARHESTGPRAGYAVEVTLRLTLEQRPPTRAPFDEFLAGRVLKPREVPRGGGDPEPSSAGSDARLAVIARSNAAITRRSNLATASWPCPHIADIEALMHVATIQEPADGGPL